MCAIEGGGSSVDPDSPQVLIIFLSFFVSLDLLHIAAKIGSKIHENFYPFPRIIEPPPQLCPNRKIRPPLPPMEYIFF